MNFELKRLLWIFEWNDILTNSFLRKSEKNVLKKKVEKTEDINLSDAQA